MKICITCKKSKSVGEFPPNSKNKDGLNRKCRDCYNEYMRLWYQKNSDLHKGRVNSSRKKNPDLYRAAKYGITKEDIHRITSTNGGLCEICGVRPGECIDHDHETGRVRGHLCGMCNKGLGFFGDDLDKLRAAAVYLEQSVGYAPIV